MIKIAIFHNLKQGGGLNILKNVSLNLLKMGYKIDIYTHQKELNIPKTTHYYYPTSTTNNSIQQLILSLFELNKIEKEISDCIQKKRYDYILVFPCHIIQSPHILKYLPKDKTYYFFLEPKREFYEKTSFDYYTPKRFITRMIRLPIKFLDIQNCKSTKNIISDSVYTQNNLKKIYNKKSILVYPGIKHKTYSKSLNVKNNHRFLSLSILTMLKGHHISAKLFPKVEIYGEKSHENIKNFLPKHISIETIFSHKNKNNIYKKFTFFLANQIKEPFGLTTLEALSNDCYVFGTNEAGTSEIITNGINGTLLPITELSKSKKLIQKINSKKYISLRKKCIIDWKHTTKNILKVINHE